MHKSPKEKGDIEKASEVKGEHGDDPCWAEKLGYYYDDTHGYEKYEADEEDEEEETRTASEDL